MKSHVQNELRLGRQRDRARDIACSLEEENAQLTELLTDACAFLTSEDAYDITELLEKSHALGIPVYDGIARCELCGNTRLDDSSRDACLRGEPYAPVKQRADGMVLCQPCEDGRVALAKEGS